jgi:hypothetical protein
MPHSVFLQHSILSTALIFGLPSAHAADTSSALDTATIEQITGLTGKFSQEENVLKVSKPRTKVKIQVDKWVMPPFMGLTSWAAFMPAKNGLVMMQQIRPLRQDFLKLLPGKTRLLQGR